MKAIASLGTFNTLMSGPARQGTFSEKVCGCCNRKFLHRLGGVPLQVWPEKVLAAHQANMELCPESGS